MVSLEVYKKLREEINKLFANGENLWDEDEAFFKLLTKSNDSKEVLGLVKELKENGNTFFKQGKFDDALEKYGYAMAILARYDFVDEIRVEFFKLAVCILLNSAICLNKKKEFVQVGQICSIILNFDSNNVKAMFRRAMAAVELGKLDWAKLDLLMAANIDPNNREVINKLEEVNNSLQKASHSNQHQGETPTGLGICLPYPKKKIGESLEKESVMKKEEILAPQVKGAHSKSVDFNEKMEVTENENVHEKKRIEGVENVFSTRNSNLAESKCRFANRRRPGSFISISRRNYQQLMKGGSIKCFKSKLGSPMTIRARLDIEDKSKKHSVCPEMDMTNPTISDTSKSNEEKSEIMMDSRDQRDENVVKEKLDDHKKEKKVSEASWIITDIHHNHDSGSIRLDLKVRSGPSTKQDKSCNIAAMKRFKEARWRTPKDGKMQKTPTVTTHPFVICRYQVGRKRKLLYQNQLDSNQRPRKRLWFESCNVIVSCCMSTMSYTTTNRYLQDSVSPNHEKASSLDNG